MTEEASTGISPIRQARCGVVQRIGGEWRITGVSLEGPGCLLQQDMRADISSPRLCPSRRCLCPSRRQWLGWLSEIQGACSSTVRRVA